MRPPISADYHLALNLERRRRLPELDGSRPKGPYFTLALATEAVGSKFQLNCLVAVSTRLRAVRVCVISSPDY